MLLTQSAPQRPAVSGIHGKADSLLQWQKSRMDAHTNRAQELTAAFTTFTQWQAAPYLPFILKKLTEEKPSTPPQYGKTNAA